MRNTPAFVLAKDSVRISIVVAVLALILVVVVAYVPNAMASSLAQQSSGSTTCTFPTPCTATAPFTSPVASGDVVVVAIWDADGAPTSVTDSRSSSYSLLASSSAESITASIYAATLASSGSDTVTVTDSGGSSQRLVVSIFEVGGVTTAQAQASDGSGGCASACSASAVSTSSSVTFAPGSFLLAAMVCLNCTFSGGTGFTFSQPDSSFAFEYATSGVSSPTDFPASFTTSNFQGWGEAGVAFQPPSTTTTNTMSTTTTSSTTTTTSATTTMTSATATNTDPVTTNGVPQFPLGLGVLIAIAVPLLVAMKRRRLPVGR